MTPQENAELVRRGYDAFIAADIEWLNEHLHENVIWHVPGKSQLAGDYKGREAVLAFFAKSVTVALPDFEIHDVLASEDHVVALLSITWRRNDGETFADRAVQIYHVAEGQALESWTMDDDLAGFDAFIDGATATA